MRIRKRIRIDYKNIVCDFFTRRSLRPIKIDETRFISTHRRYRLKIYVPSNLRGDELREYYLREIFYNLCKGYRINSINNKKDLVLNRFVSAFSTFLSDNKQFFDRFALEEGDRYYKRLKSVVVRNKKLDKTEQTKIKYFNRLEDDNLGYSEGSSILNETWWGSITLANCLRGINLRRVMLHELFHRISDRNGIKMKQPETTIDLLAVAITDLVLYNPQIFKQW